MQRERLNAAEIELQRLVVPLVRPACFLELGVGFAPAFFQVKDGTVPEAIALRDLFFRRLAGELEPLVIYMALAHIDSAQEIDRARDDHFARQLERLQSAQN